MTELAPNVRADFFGKDRFVAFLGQVEDVNDPKHAGRVKVRCVGWHPKDKKDLPTEDLPWAKVGAPTTHAQTNRIGGKHGLLVGSWVFGCFLDGEEAQNPFVITSFPLTAKSVDQSNKSIGDGEATASESRRAFAPTTQGPDVENTGRKTTSEKGTQTTNHPEDPAGSLPSLDDSDSDCAGQAANQSASSAERGSKLEQGTPAAQDYKVAKADGLCGPMAHAKEDIQRNIEEKLPSAVSRFLYNDAVWDAVSGDYSSSNAAMQELAQLICNLLKQPANAEKANKQEENRKKQAEEQVAEPDRDGVDRTEKDKQASCKDDNMHAIYQETLIDVLCSIVMQLLQAMSNDDSSDDNFGGEGNNTNIIQNPSAECLTDNLLNNMNIIVQDTLKTADEAAEDIEDDDESTSDIIFGTLIGGMAFVLTQQYASNKEVHNCAGERSQDQRTKQQGCNPERLFSTLNGFLNGGFGSGSGGGNGTGGNDNDFSGIGFGGSAAPNSTEVVTQPCEGATTPVIPDPGFEPDGTPKPVPPDVNTRPDGGGGAVLPLPLPSDDEICARNFVNGIPNSVIIINPGGKYFYNNPLTPERGFPTVYIPGYVGRPIPVVDRISGEIVSIITTCSSWPNRPQPPVSILPDDSEIGITTDDPNYDIVLGGFHIANTGFEYCEPVIEVWDKDKETNLNGEARPVVVDGRIVAVDVINNGTGFRRIPEIRIYDDGKNCGTDGGFGAILFPIMTVVPKPDAKGPQIPVEVIYCPAHRNKNLY